VGLRGLHAVPLSRWIPVEAKPMPRCRHCGRYFTHRRSDAKYCCDSHKVLACLKRQQKMKSAFPQTPPARRAARWKTKISAGPRKDKRPANVPKDKRKNENGDLRTR
jgi:hypothetical protein